MYHRLRLILLRNTMVTLSLGQGGMRLLFLRVNRFLCESKFSAHLGKYLGTRLPCCVMGVWFDKMLPVGLTDVTTPFCITTSSESLHCSAASPAFGIGRRWDVGRSHRHTVALTVVFLVTDGAELICIC